MKNKKLTVAILCGGRSAEHQVSLISARDVLNAADKDKYSFLLIGIDREGKWSLYDVEDFLAKQSDVGSARLMEGTGEELAWVLGKRGGASLVPLGEQSRQLRLDVVFPLLHGPYGEDGTVQGLCRLADLPFVGSDVTASAVCMDKGVSKRLLWQAGLAVARFMEIRRGEAIDTEQISRRLGMPVFIKPANLGSSVGVSKAQTESQVRAAMERAFAYDTKILVEEAIEGQEVECAVLGNEQPVVSGVGEIIPQDEFYTYKAKYLDEHGAELRVPAHLTPAKREEVRGLALQAYQVLGCEGMARVDCFVTKAGHVLVNEVNTIPGFTPISMYPRLWEATGLTYRELIDRLIELALERHTRNSRLKTEVAPGD